MKTVDEKRMERIKKLSIKFSKIKREDIESLPEWYKEEAIEILKDMENHFLWLQNYLSPAIETKIEKPPFYAGGKKQCTKGMENP